jgi:hypothetical protein
LKEYLITVSWVDPEQPLRRKKLTVLEEFSKEDFSWPPAITDKVEKAYLSREYPTNLAIDFMMEVPN